MIPLDRHDRARHRALRERIRLSTKKSRQYQPMIQFRKAQCQTKSREMRACAEGRVSTITGHRGALRIRIGGGDSGQPTVSLNPVRWFPHMTTNVSSLLLHIDSRIRLLSATAP